MPGIASWLAVALMVAIGAGLYIRLWWWRAPQARRAMIVLALCYLASGTVIGGAITLLTFTHPSAPTPSTVPGPSPATSPQAAASASATPATPEPTYVPITSCTCGSERWAIKTLTDQDKSKVNLAPVATTIGDLIKIPAPDHLPEDRRISPIELTTYTVKAVVIEFKREKDDDFHIVIADPTDLSKTMIAEIVEPCCAEGSPELEKFKKVRAEFIAVYGPTTSFVGPLGTIDVHAYLWNYLAAKGVGIDAGHPVKAPIENNGLVCGEPFGHFKGATVEITGIGFFDFQHGQNGVAPNAIELHPVLSVRRVE